MELEFKHMHIATLTHTASQIIIVVFPVYFANHLYFTYFLKFLNIPLCFQILTFDNEHINEILNRQQTIFLSEVKGCLHLEI